MYSSTDRVCMKCKVAKAVTIARMKDPFCRFEF